jgi:hypothetical protein
MQSLTLEKLKSNQAPTRLIQEAIEFVYASLPRIAGYFLEAEFQILK